ncbi:MAG: M4 family metallopeptidase [Candidatus Eisenbacteria bacterium]|uniref:M4 family metallopeptidase n=1 Tax=Eiseniibacteriota bacterium TaxID=2212470 RepID=A0A937XAL1_UNCEI|nr:M4 family metallopeptidase [Candidatus Eisenbacteria bacterium]
MRRAWPAILLALLVSLPLLPARGPGGGIAGAAPAGEAAGRGGIAGPGEALSPAPETPWPWNPPAPRPSALPERLEESPSAPALAAKRPEGSVRGDRAAAPPPEEILSRVRARLDLLGVADRHGLAAEVEAGYLTSPEAIEDLIGLRAAQTPDRPLRLFWRPETGTPRLIAGADLLGAGTAGGDPEAAARAFLARHRALLGLADPERELRVFRLEAGRDGGCAVRLQRHHEGLPVWGQDAIVRCDPAGRVIGFSGCYAPTPAEPLSTTPECARARASEAALAALRERDGAAAEVEEVELLFYPWEGRLVLAWAVTASAGLDYRQQAFVAAADGAFLHAVSLVAPGAASGQGLDLQGVARALGLWEASGTYYLIDASKPMFNAAASRMPDDPRGAVWTLSANHTNLTRLYQVTSTDPQDWSERANAVSAAWGSALWYDFLLQTFGRNSYDGAGRTITAVVDVGTRYNNAFWNGNLIAFGNGDGVIFSDLAGALDVIGHELGHAVVEYTANLVYEFQPGALNEHMADVFGALTEWYAAELSGGSGNWWIGEDVTTPGIPGDCLRNMAEPDAPNVYDPPAPHYPTHMDEYFDWPANQDYGGVHINNTILSRAFVMVCDEIGRDESAQIWYRALTHYLQRNSQFIDLRLGALQSTEDLHGAGAAEIAAVAAAFDAVGVVGGEGTPDLPDLPGNDGDDYLALVRGASRHIFRAPPDWNGSDALEDISGNTAGAGGRPSFSDDGRVCAWVDQGGNIFVAQSNGSARRQITSDGLWWSVAMSPEGRQVAATTVFEDARIYRFDLEDPAQNAVFELTTQNDSGDGEHDAVVFADVMEYTVTGEFILYDALNRAEVEGDTHQYWDVNKLRLADGQCFRVFQSLPRGENIGNPTLAQNRDDVVAYDHIDAAGRVRVMATRLTTGATGLVTNNGFQLGHPAFDGDDRGIYYEYAAKPFSGVWRVGLLEDGLTGAGNDALWARSVSAPVWFTIGTRPSPVLLDFLSGVWRGTTIEIAWRVFDPAGLTGFHVDRRRPDGGLERRTAGPIPVGEAVEEVFLFVDDAPAHRGPIEYRLTGLGADGAPVSLGALEVRPEGPTAAGGSPLFRTLHPNPCPGEMQLTFVLPRPERADLTIHDIAGRRVAWPVRGAALGAGEHRLEWAARDERGRRLDAGVYQLRLAAGPWRESRTLILLP